MTAATNKQPAMPDASAPKPTPEISPDKKVLAQYANNAWRCVAPAGALPEQFDMVDGPFNLIAKDLTVQDDIRLIAADGSWIADYIVVDCGATYALARMTQAIQLPERRADATDRIPQDFRIVHARPDDEQQGWLVFRKSDDVLMNFGNVCHRKEDAIAYVLNHASVRGNYNPTVFGKPASA